MNNDIGLYIHIPFCKSKCSYCNFYSKCSSENDYDTYTKLLCSKIKLWSKKVSYKIKTIYFGGGTPSVLGTERLCFILSEIYKYFSVNNDAEITLEVNPESGKDLDYKQLSQCGFNRLSIGIQSSNNNELKALGRIHTINDVQTTVNSAKKFGFSNISVDLMLGIPFQTINSLEKSIDFCVNLGVTHISAYMLKIEENTKFYKIKNELVLPTDTQTADFYLFLINKLKQNGFEQYEISNFCKDGIYSIHNANYWVCGEYLGIGPSAHSFIDNKRFYYPNNLKNFENDNTIFDCIGGDEEEYIIMRLRTNHGLNFKSYYKKYNNNVSDELLSKAKKYCKDNYVIIDKCGIRLTPKGFLVSNTILSDLI